MPAQVIHVQGQTLAHLPTSAFVETSFLRDAIAWKRAQQGGARARQASDFLGQLTRGRVDVWTTAAVVEETLFGLLKPAIRRAAPLGANGKPLNWADFKNQDPVAFAHVFQCYAPRIATGVGRILRTEGIEVRLPRIAGRRGRTGAVLYGMMRYLLRHYVIEPADAMHYASAWVDGTSAILSNDAGFQEIDGAQVYTSL